MASTQSPIAKLGPELVLIIFEAIAEDDTASLTSAALCCKAWAPLARHVLYGDVVLDERRLARFVLQRVDTPIRSLTVEMGPITVRGYDHMTPRAESALSRLARLRELGTRVQQMQFATLSLSVDLTFPFTAAREVAFILERLPTSCTSLEVKLTHRDTIPAIPIGAFKNGSPYRQTHLCETIRTLLPRLRHLRVCLPVLCPALLSAGLHAVRAPSLRTCVINLAPREPGLVVRGGWTAPCGDDPPRDSFYGNSENVAFALPPMSDVLQDFARQNSASLETFTVLDVKPRNPHLPEDRQGWVRRDFLARTSRPVPFWKLYIKNTDTHWYAARVPSSSSPESSGETKDCLSTSVGWLESLAEGETWQTVTASGARLPPRALRKRHRVPTAAWTRARFRHRHAATCVLWVDEEATGQRLLPTGPGELMHRWDLRVTVPAGWERRDPVGFRRNVHLVPLVRVGD
ncbi:hypothetical protein F4780DRAFT_764206 [Xylariomycetidae sp. FL0641]|nr:hypothetical protein F4780DRAFT_764206 [Xylariomycetidae sp. FL0641]